MVDLKTCDMVLAISEETINYQFYLLRKQNIVHTNWNIVLYDDGTAHVNQNKADFEKDIEKEEFACAFYANISDPKISILESEQKTVNFFIPFESGTMYYWKGHGKIATIETVDMDDWIYAFKVQIGLIEKSVTDDPSLSWMITEESRESLNEVINNSGLDQKYFTIESLFLELENANYADYDAKASNIPVDIAILADFQSLLSNYFKELANTDNPYILGYAVKVKDIPDQEEAMFEPTALRYSTTYNENPKLRAFNFLMVTNEEGSFSDDEGVSPEDVGVFPKSLITDPDSDGELVINAELFCKNIIDTIDFATIYSESLNTVENLIEVYDMDDGMFSAETTLVDKPGNYEGKLKEEEYGLSAIKEPYVFTLEGSNSFSVFASKSESSFNEMTSFVPIIKFFDKNFAIKQQTVTKQVELRKLNGWYSKKEWKDYSYSIEKFDKSLDNAVYLGVAHYIYAKQNTRSKPCQGLGCIASTSDKDCNTESPQFTYYKIGAGANGKITVTDHTFELETKGDRKLLKSDKKNVIGNSINNFEENLKNAIVKSQEEITKAIKSLAMNKVIFPCNKIYAYKDLRFESNTDNTEISDNYVKVKVNYESETT
jgi:hypothetical protein